MIIILLAIIAVALLLGPHAALIALGVFLPMLIIWKLLLFWAKAKVKVKEAAASLTAGMGHEGLIALSQQKTERPYWMKPWFATCQVIAIAIGWFIIIEVGVVVGHWVGWN